MITAVTDVILDQFEGRFRDWRVVCDHSNNMDEDHVNVDLIFQPAGSFMQYKIEFVVNRNVAI